MVFFLSPRHSFSLRVSLSLSPSLFLSPRVSLSLPVSLSLSPEHQQLHTAVVVGDEEVGEVVVAGTDSEFI